MADVLTRSRFASDQSSAAYDRLRDIGGSILAAEAVALPAHAPYVAQGRFLISSTGRLTLTLAGNVRVTIANPAGSGRNLNLLRLAGMATAVAFGSTFLNPSTGIPATAIRPRLNAIVGGGDPGVGQVRADTNTTAMAAGTGTDLGISLGFGSGQRTQIDLPPLVLTPGQTLGVNVSFAGAGDVEAAAYWYETDA